MNDPLATKYRPRKFRNIVGQRMVSIILNKMVEANSIPNGLLFTGTHGTGKTSVARILASALNCPEQADGEPCGACVSCRAIASSSSLAVIEVDAASSGSVADVRALIETLRYSAGGDTRVVIFDEAHSMSREAFNALLKTLEEPPAGTIFILVTTEPHKIPPTVKSRLLEFEFRQVSREDIAVRLVATARNEGLDIPQEFFPYLADRAQGSVRDAVMSLDYVRLSGVRSIAEFEKLTGEADGSERLLAAMISGKHDIIFSVLDTILSANGDPGRVSAQLIQCFADLLVLRAGGDIKATGSSLDARTAIAARLAPDTVLAALRVLWDLKTKIRVADDPRGNLTLALVLVSEVLTRGKKSSPSSAPAPAAPQPEVEEPNRKLKLSELTL